MKKIYLDNAATTSVAPEVLKAMQPYFSEKFGNASSTHDMGQQAKIVLEAARSQIAKAIGAKSNEIIFTSSGTESNNFALKGIAFANHKNPFNGFLGCRKQKTVFQHKDKGKRHIITTKIEHNSILECCKWLESQGFEVTYLNVDKKGFVNPEHLARTIRKDTILVSIIHGNNEIGTIQNITELGKICHEKNILFHTDSCQSLTKVLINVKRQNVDLMTLNAHKIHGPKGVGAIYLKQGVKIKPLLHGGGHENGLRSGTENIPGIAGFAKAVQLATPNHVKYMTKLRDMLIEGILKLPGTKLNGPGIDEGDKRLCNNTNFIFENIDSDSLGAYLEMNSIYSSTASACLSHSQLSEPSHVLTSIGLTPEEARTSLRLTLSRFNTKEEIEKTLEVLEKAVKKLRKISFLDKLIK